MENPNTGILKSAPVGFSWTTFFFGPLPALIRGDFLGALVLLILFFIAVGFSVMGLLFVVAKLMASFDTTLDPNYNHAVVASAQNSLTFSTIFCLIIAGIIAFSYGFMYNKIHIKKLLKNGFKVKVVEEGTLENARTKLGINLPKLETET